MCRSKSSALAVGARSSLNSEALLTRQDKLHAARPALADQRLGLPRRGEVGAHRLGLAARRRDVRHGLRAASAVERLWWTKTK